VRALVFLLVVLSVVAVVHGYLWRRLVRDTTSPGRTRRAGTIAVVLVAVLVPASILIGRVAPPELDPVLVWTGYLWLAVMFYLLVTLVLLEPVRALGWLLRRRRSGGGASPTVTADDPSRRQLLGRVLAGTAAVATGGTVAYGIRSATSPPDIRRVEVSLSRLASDLDGFSIAVLGDVHLGPAIGRDFLVEVVRRVNAARPDAVAIVGDLVDGTVDELGDAARPLADLDARDGVYFVTGNHEYYSGVEPWLEFLPTLGVRVLRNERVEIRRGTGAFDLAGVDDVTAEDSGVGGHGTDLGAALDGRDEGRPVVLLCHQPVIAGEAADRGVDLQISAHTHGGQVVPFNVFVRLQQPVVSGLARIRRTWVYVSRGVGFWGPPVRVGAPSEISLIVLRRHG